MKVILLGAGASKAYADSPAKLRIPIAKEFFSTYPKLEISGNGWVLVGSLIHYLKRYNHIQNDLDLINFEKDIEELHTEIENRLFSIIKNPVDLSHDEFAELHLCFKAYTQLIFLFANVLNEIQNGPVSKPHINLGKHLTPEDVIITFNWDTLMDRALQTASDWNCHTGYFAKPFAVYNNGWKANTGSEISSSPTTS